MTIWRILELLFTPLLILDHWLLKRYQWLADWAYTLWDVSPYWIAAKLFSITACFHIIAQGIDMSFAAQPKKDLFFTGLNVIFNFIWFIDASMQDKSWARSHLAPPPKPERMVSRVIFTSLFIVMSLAVFLGAFSGPPASTNLVESYPTVLVLYVGTLTVTSGFFFQSCMPPTPKPRREPAAKLAYAKM